MYGKLKAWFLLGTIEKEGIRRRIVLNKIRKLLKGKKTYIVGISAIFGAIAAWVNGTIDNMKMLELVVEGAMGMTIRGGISGLKEKS